MDEIHELKKKLKKWEIGFFKDKGRKPEKAEIDQAPEEIKDAYAKYNKLKKEKNQQVEDLSDTGNKLEKEQKFISEGCNREKEKLSCKISVDKELDDSTVKNEKACDDKPISNNSDVWGREFDKQIVGTVIEEARHNEKVQEMSSNYLQGLSSKLYEHSLKFGSKSSKVTKQTRKDNSSKHMPLSVKSNDSNEEITPKENETETFRVKGNIFERALQFTQKKKSISVRDSNDEVIITNKYNIKTKSKYSVSLSQKLAVDDKYEVSFNSSEETGEKNEGNHNVIGHHSVKCIAEMCQDEVDGIASHSAPPHGNRSHLHSGSTADIDTSVTLTHMDVFKEQNKNQKPTLSSFDKNLYYDPSRIKVSDQQISENRNKRDNLSDYTIKSSVSKKEVNISSRNVNPADHTLNVKESDIKEKHSTVDFHPFDFTEKDDVDVCEDYEDVPIKSKQSRKRKLKDLSDNPTKMKRKSVRKEETELKTERVDDCDDKKTRITSSTSRGKGRSAVASDGNFVKLNMKIKTYKRKGKGKTGPQMKRFQWKQKMKARKQSLGNKCFKCGQEGHWANKCPDQNKEVYGSADDKPSVLEEDFPTMQEAAQMARGIKQTQQRFAPSNSKVAKQDVKEDEKNDDTQDNTNVGNIDWDANIDPEADEDVEIQSGIVRSRREQTVAPPPLSPLVNKEQNSIDVKNLMKEGLKKFGYDDYRLGQEKAVKRILTGKSTLVVMSTGGGKSLCYQLPAYLYAQRSKAITLVISPLVSLMEDQVTGLPQGIRGACIHTNMTASQREGVLSSVKEGKVHFLLVSPEAVAGGGMTLLNNKANLPPIAFVCIDEAHCLSEWSHNFRPSYLRLTKVLREKFGVECFLGLTATATTSTAKDVAKHLQITDFDEAVIRGPPVPQNLFLSVSRDENRDEALLGLLQGERFSKCESIIVYCTRREQTERLATLIRTCLKDEKGLESWDEEQKRKQKGRKKTYSFWDAESYHAGMTAAQRKRVQTAFMTSRLRVVVATVAFGMGLDKSDVRGVIHYNMPKSFESYVQEIGRAGRDGKDSQCHLFLDQEGRDVSELKRHTFANTVDYRTLKKFLQKIFPSCHCKRVHGLQNYTKNDDTASVGDNDKRICPGHERALSIESTVMDLDLKEEGISTLMCYMELHDKRWLENLVNVYSMCKLQCYGGPAQLQSVAKKCPPVAVAIAKAKKDGKTFSNSNSIEFPVVEISDCMGWDSGPVKRELKLLSWEFNKSGNTGPRRSGVMVEFSDLAFHFISPGDLTDEEQDDVLQFLHERVQKQEKEELQQIGYLCQSLRSASHKNYWMCSDELDLAKNDRLKAILRDYFTEQIQMQAELESQPESSALSQDLGQVTADIRQLIGVHGHEHRFTGRAIARIFHGIGSPCFPATTWGRNRRYWRSHMHLDFNLIIKIATQELIKLR